MDYKSIFITGASSGIGEALALEYAAPGVTLGLAARRTDVLEQVRERVAKKGARVFLYTLDVIDREASIDAAKDFLEKAGGADLVVANAGVGYDIANTPNDDTQALANLADINFKGVLHTIAPFIEPMRERGGGHLAAVGSVAGFRALPGGSYSATKAAVRNMMDSWRIAYGNTGIHFTTLCPGFIATPMTESLKGKMMFVISAKEAARLVRRGLDAKKKTFVFPWLWRLVIPIMKVLPDWAMRRIAQINSPFTS